MSKSKKYYNSDSDDEVDEEYEKQLKILNKQLMPQHIKYLQSTDYANEAEVEKYKKSKEDKVKEKLKEKVVDLKDENKELKKHIKALEKHIVKLEK